MCRKAKTAPRLQLVRAFLACVLLGSIGCAKAIAAEPEIASLGEENGVLRATLANGLRVIVVRNALAPVVATSVNYLVGSDEAPAGFPGMAHAQEHMMFRGSPDLSADQLAQIGGAMGGNFNANTREELTQYLFTVPAEDLDVALRIEATRMRDVLDSQEDWDKERGAIEQEVAQDLSEPGYVLYSRIRAAMFAGTPYEHDALGTRPSFEKTNARMLKDFYAKWYAPSSAILVIAGDVDPATTLRKVEQLFGDIQPKKIPSRPEVKLGPVQPIRFSVDTDRASGTLMLALRTVGPRSPDYPALEVLSGVLSSHRFDLYRLVPDGKAIDAAFELEPLPQAGVAYATISFTAGADATTLESEVRAILARVAHDGVPADLVDAVKLQERTAAQLQRNSIPDLASLWSDAVALYDLQSPDDDLQRIEQVTVADVNRVARKYLDLDHAVCGVMLPRGSGGPVQSSGQGFGGQESIALDQEKPATLPPWAEAALRRVVVPRSRVQPVVSILPNGLTLMVQKTDVSDTVSVYGHVRNSPEMQEPVGQEGIAQVLDHLLPYGSGRLDRVAFQQALDAIGASAGAGTDFSVQALSENFDRAVELLAENELNPALPASALAVAKNQMAQVVAARSSSPGFLTDHSLREALFPPHDPSLRIATPESVNAVTYDALRRYYRATFRPDLTTIVVVGNVTPERARAVIEKYFGGWTAAGPKPATELPPVPHNRAKTVAVPDASRVQNTVVIAETLGITRSDRDYYALQLGNAVLGGGFYSSRLSIDLRKNAGLVYSVGSALQAGRTRGLYFARYASDPQNVAKAAKIIAQEIEAMRKRPASAGELARAKALLVRQIPLSEASVDDIALGLLARSDLGLPLDEPILAARRYVELRPADVQAAFRKWLRPDDLVRISEGPPP